MLCNTELSGTELSLSSIRGLAMTAYVKQLAGFFKSRLKLWKQFNGGDVKLKKQLSDSTPIPPAFVKTRHLYDDGVRLQEKIISCHHGSTFKDRKTFSATSWPKMGILQLGGCPWAYCCWTTRFVEIFQISQLLHDSVHQVCDMDR